MAVTNHRYRCGTLCIAAVPQDGYVPKVPNSVGGTKDRDQSDSGQSRSF